MFFFNKPVLAQEQDGLLQLEAQGLRLDKLQRAIIHLVKPLSALAISLLLEVSDDSVQCALRLSRSLLWPSTSPSQPERGNAKNFS